MPKRDNHLAARALADWARSNFNTSEASAIAERYGIKVRTVWNWKNALDTDEQLSVLFKDALQVHLTGDWADQLDDALTTAIKRMKALVEESDDLGKVTEAFHKLSEVAMGRELLRGAIHGQQAARPTQASGTPASEVPPTTFGPS